MRLPWERTTGYACVMQGGREKFNRCTTILVGNPPCTCPPVQDPGVDEPLSQRNWDGDGA